MDAVAPLLAAVVGVFGGYILGNRRLQYEHLLEHRAEVMAEMSKRVDAALRGVEGFTALPSPSEAGKKRSKALPAAYTELGEYYRSNEVWLTPVACRKIEAFLDRVWELMDEYDQTLDERGHPRDIEWSRGVGRQIRRELERLRTELIAGFREILYPPPWYEAPLRWLEWLETRVRKDGSQE